MERQKSIRIERQKDITLMGASDIPINEVYEQHTRSSTKQEGREKKENTSNLTTIEKETTRERQR
jgi:hypothetical protein